MLTTRETASVFWLGVLLIWALTSRDVRGSLADVLHSFFKWKILILLIVYAAYIATLTYAAARLRLWEGFLLKNTVIWFVLSGFPLLFNVDEVAKDLHFFSRKVRSIFAMSAFVEFFVNTISFNLFAELVIQPVIAVAIAIVIVAPDDEGGRQVRKLFQRLLGIAGIVLMLLTSLEIYSQRAVLESGQIWRSLALTIWLPIAALPFLYLFALVACYEAAFQRLAYFDRDNGHRRFIPRLALLVGTNVHLQEVHAFHWNWPAELAEAPGFQQALQHVREFRAWNSAQRVAKQSVENNFNRFAGVDGVDKDGKRLDRREFDETQESLRFLATCQMGWYRNPGGCYRADLLDILVGSFPKLPKNHGIVMRVRGDGQAWYAWRRTISGWVFGIGAASPPSDQWLYDGVDPPAGYPGTELTWDHFAPDKFAVNW